MKIHFVLTLTVLLLAAPAVGQVEFMGDKFQINAVTTADQLFPDAASTADGNFLVVWQSDAGTDGDLTSIAGRFFGSDGTPLASEFQVNTYATGRQQRPAVAADGDGHLVVVWQSEGSAGSDADGSSIQGRRFAPDGAALGDEFQVNAYVTGDQSHPAVAMDAGGGFVVVWQSEGSAGSDSDGNSIQGRRFAPDGTALGDEFQVNTYTTRNQRTPAVAMAGNGDFVVVWGSYNGVYLRTNYDILGQRFAADGMTMGSEFVVSETLPYETYDPSVAVNGEGEFVVVWADHNLFPFHFAYSLILGRGFAADGSPLGQFVVDGVSYLDSLSHPDVMMERGDNFVVTWAQSSSYDTIDIEGGRVRSDGTVLGSHFAVEDDATSAGNNPALARDSAGRFMVVWESGSWSSDWNVFGRRFAEFFFADGFESGDTLAWSATVP